MKFILRGYQCVIIAFILCFWFPDVIAQNTEFKGVLLDHSSDTGIEGATVELRSVAGSVLNSASTSTTSKDGDFTVDLNAMVNQGDEIVLTIKHPEYAAVDVSAIYQPYETHKIRLQSRQLYIRAAGKVTDATTGEPIEFVTIQITPAVENSDLVRPIGTVTDENGEYDFTFRFSTPYKMFFSHVAYRPKEIEVNSPLYKQRETELVLESISGDEIVVVSNIVEQNDLEESVTIDRISSLDVQEVASMSAFDLVSTLREVDVSTQSMNMQTVSTRGFNTGANPRFLQLTDGVDNQAPGLGFPVGNLMGPSDLDIAVVDLIVGPASARYGSNAMNGVLLTSTKDPFVAQGISLSAKTGMHHFKFGGADPWAVQGDGMYDFSLRYAKAFNDKFAVKVTGQLLSGTDWRANNYDNIGPGRSSLRANDISGYNGINVYGDEGGVMARVGINENNEFTGDLVPVRRTGYKEAELVDYDISTQKVGVSLQYKFTDDILLMAEGRYGYTNTLYTSDSRIRLENFKMAQYRGKFSTSNFNLSGYVTTQNSGDSYNVNYLADNLLRSAKSDRDWYRDYEIAFTQGLPIYGVARYDVKGAREFADSGITLLSSSSAEGMYEPGTQKFEEELNRLKSIYRFDEGAGIKDNSTLYHVEADHEFAELLGESTLNIGGAFRYYDLDSGGTIFPDTTGNNMSNYDTGLYANLKKSFFDGDLKLLFAARIDKNENFNLIFNKQAGLNYQYKEKHFLRFSFQSGARNPTVREQFLNSSISNARLLGGLNFIHDPYELEKNSFSERFVQAYQEAVASDLNAYQSDFNRAQAELNNLPILEKGILGENDLPRIKPERTVGLEAGYRQLITSRLYFDMNYFVSFYTDFIGIGRLIKPRTSPSEDLYTAAGQATSSVESDRFYVYSNSEDQVIAQGVSFDLRYNSGNFQSSLNGTWTNLINESNDPIIPGYNTPPLKINFEWGNRELVKNVGFKMIFRGRTEYDWKSPFLDGTINGYGHFDFQFTIRFPPVNAVLKSGVTNLGVLPYYDSFGGPQIGSILFSTLTIRP